MLVQAAPMGHFEAVLNHAQLVQTWEVLAQSLCNSTTAEGQITLPLLEAVAKQLQEPADIVRSLSHNYVYAALIPAF